MIKRIVIADDSTMARMFTRRCLEIAGCQGATFVEASNGEEALKLLKEEKADLLVTDLHMPVLDGEQLLSRILASPKLSGLPVIVITSADNPAKEKRFREMGAFAVLGKPVSPSVLAQALAPLLRKEEKE